MFTSIKEVKAANKNLGHFWFSPGNMRFARTIIETKLIHTATGTFFVTSESYSETSPRLYTVRQVESDGSIETADGFQKYASRGEAIDAIKGF